MSTVQLLVTLLIIRVNFSSANPVVRLPNGLIQGRKATTLQNTTYYAFEKIPYAKAPIGELRFRAPQPPDNWEGILETTHLDVSCYQSKIAEDYESEDCLFINVFTPQLPKNDGVLLPTMLYIHGGGFAFGSSINLQSEHFIDRNVILVTINYRLGPLGFLSTQDEVIPGNNGLKDQHLAIKWTHDNINLFGGNPNKITIFGESAGSASVAYQLLNKKSKGLFSGAILESGSFLSPWSYQRRAREIAFIVGNLLDSNFHNNDSITLLRFLRSVSAEDLDKAALLYNDIASGPQNLGVAQGQYWAPVIETKNPDAFLTQKMFGLLRDGKIVTVPTLIGITSEEGLHFNKDPVVLKSYMTAYDKHLEWLVPNDMQIANLSKRIEMGRLIREIYTGGKPLANHLGAGVRYFSDTSFTRSIIKHAELQSKLSKIYFYQFSYDGIAGNVDLHYDGAESVAHTEDLAYLFCSGKDCNFNNYPEKDQVTIKRMVEIWTNFAKYQNPTPKPSELLQNITWPLVSTDGGDFLYVDINETLQIKNWPKQETYFKWIKLYDSLDFDDFDTY